MYPNYLGGAVGEGVHRVSRARPHFAHPFGIEKEEEPNQRGGDDNKKKEKAHRAQIAAAGFLLLPTGTLLHQLELEQAREFFRISFFRLCLPSSIIQNISHSPERPNKFCDRTETEPPAGSLCAANGLFRLLRSPWLFP